MNEWISVAERLPPRGKFVLTRRGQARPKILCIRYMHSADGGGPLWADENGYTGFIHGPDGFDPPTYWMPFPPLPEPPS